MCLKINRKQVPPRQRGIDGIGDTLVATVRSSIHQPMAQPGAQVSTTKTVTIGLCQIVLAVAGYTLCWQHNITGMVLALVAATAVAVIKDTK